MTDHMTLLAEISDTVQRLTVGWTDTVITPAADPDDRPHDKTTVKGTIAFPGLINQLYNALTGTSTEDPAAGFLKPAPNSKPPVAEEPFDVLLAIDQFTETAPTPWGGLVGWAATQPTDVVAALALELKALQRRADIALGFAYAPRELEGKCPACGAAGKVVAYRDDDGIPTSAQCRACKVTWDTPVLPLLAKALGES